MGGLTGDLFIQLTSTLAHLSNLTNHNIQYIKVEELRTYSHCKKGTLICQRGMRQQFCAKVTSKNVQFLLLCL